jgi:pimeloyl-ACP methyl ester carboxylesterase
VTVLEAGRKQTRARYPDEEGYVDRDGVRVFYEAYGYGAPTVFLLPTWSIIHSRHWKMQISYFARHFRVLTLDGRGNGMADRPSGIGAYTEHEFAADSLAVMDATGTESAVVVGLSCGALWGTLLAADHPGRVLGAVFICPSVPLAPGHPERNVHSFEDRLDTEDGWAKYNRHYWVEHYKEFLEYFFGMMFSEPHSTKQIEDCVGWGLEIAPETLIETHEALELCGAERFRDVCARVRCPVLVLHGGDDGLHPVSRGAALAEATGGTLVTLEGSGHCPHARDPVRVNLLIREFVDSLEKRAR